MLSIMSRMRPFTAVGYRCFTAATTQSAPVYSHRRRFLSIDNNHSTILLCQQSAVHHRRWYVSSSTETPTKQSDVGANGQYQRMRRFMRRMNDDDRNRRQAEIDAQRNEQKPKGLIQLFKYYVKRYWYIAIGVHCVGSILWFSTAYLAVANGVDVISLLEFLHLPDSWIDKIRNAPPAAADFVVALLLYKIATPLRYMISIVFIQLVVKMLQRRGKLQTAKEVSYRSRVAFEKATDRLPKLRFQQRRKNGSGTNGGVAGRKTTKSH